MADAAASQIPQKMQRIRIQQLVCLLNTNFIFGPSALRQNVGIKSPKMANLSYGGSPTTNLAVCPRTVSFIWRWSESVSLFMVENKPQWTKSVKTPGQKVWTSDSSFRQQAAALLLSLRVNAAVSLPRCRRSLSSVTPEQTHRFSQYHT